MRRGASGHFDVIARKSRENGLRLPVTLDEVLLRSEGTSSIANVQMLKYDVLRAE